MTSRTERMLLEDAEQHGWIGLRAPGSGARPGSDAGDLWIGREARFERHLGPHDLQEMYSGDAPPAQWSELLFVEEKYSKSKERRDIRVSCDQLTGMIELAMEMGARPVLAVRWSSRCPHAIGPTHYLIDALRLNIPDDQKSMGITPDDALDTFEPTERFFTGENR